MPTINNPVSWLEWCNRCKKKHKVTLKPCPDCGVYTTPQPISDNVTNKCTANYRCDGCNAYLDHLY